MSNQKLTYGEVWKTLRAIDTTKIQYQKSGLDYIGWADAWACLMQHYPNSTYECPSPTLYFYGQENKTCEVHCKVIIGDLSREFSLPVMTSMMPMKSIVNPTSRDITDAKARCMVKVLGMFGLGLHLWEKGSSKPQKKSNPEVTDFGGF